MLLPLVWGSTGKETQDQPRRARGCKNYDKQQPQRMVALSHNALRAITADAEM
jgi:hypothetical protein